MSVNEIEKEFLELISRISLKEIDRNKKLARSIEEMRRAIELLKKEWGSKAQLPRL